MKPVGCKGEWFKGGGHYSFPSGEVTLVASTVAPFVFEYGRDHPMVYGLELSTWSPDNL